MRKPFLLLLLLCSAAVATFAQSKKTMSDEDIFNALDEPLETILQDKITDQQKTIDSLKHRCRSLQFQNRENEERLDAAQKAVALMAFLHELEVKTAGNAASRMEINEHFEIPDQSLDFLPGKSIDTLLKNYPHCRALIKAKKLALVVLPPIRITAASAPGIILPPLISGGYTAETSYQELVDQARAWQSYIIDLNARCKSSIDINTYFSNLEPAKLKQAEAKEKRKLTPTEQQKTLIDLRKKFATLILNNCQN